MICAFINTTILLSSLSLFIALSSCSQAPYNDAKLAHHHSGALPDDGSIRLLELINQGRSKKHLPPLTLDTRLTLAALDHSSAMQRHGEFEHRVKGERGFMKRLLARGYPPSHAAENIAKAPLPDQVYLLWYNSRGHYDNMFNRKYLYVGIARSGHYWTADFAAPDGL